MSSKQSSPTAEDLRRAAAEPPEPLEAKLRDGTQVLLRPIRADDKQRLQDGLRLLSAESRYLRFHTPVSRLSAKQLRYLTEVDYRDHMAWVALDPARPDLPGVGVARYVRLKDEPAVAEAAVTVIDEYQGRGLGTLLLGLLAQSALENGITTFRNYVLAANRPMLELFDQLGASRSLEGDGVYIVDVHLPKDPRELPDTPAGRVFKEAARGALPPIRGHFPPLWDSDEDDLSEPAGA